MIRYALTIAVSSLLLGVAGPSAFAGGWLAENIATIDEMVSHYYDEGAQVVPPVASHAARRDSIRRGINPIDRRSLLVAPEVKVRTQAPSVAISIGANGKLLLAKGYGFARPGVKAEANTLYHIGSLTKQFTAATLLSLIDRNSISRANGQAVDLDMPLQRLFFGVEHWSKEGEPPVTIRRLLTMTSNLPNFTRRLPRRLNPWGAIEAPRLMAAIKTMQPFGWPNSFEYSNTSYFLLAQVIESLTLKSETEVYSYRQRMRANIFTRAGMSATRFLGDDIGRNVLALPHDTRRPAFTKRDWLKGSADVVSNVTDLFSWNRALMRGDIVRPKMRDLMLSEAARVTPFEWYGMGWFVRPEKKQNVYYHSGTVPGYTSLNMIMVDKKTARWSCVTILTNAGQVEGLDRLALDIAKLALD